MIMTQIQPRFFLTRQSEMRLLVKRQPMGRWVVLGTFGTPLAWWEVQVGDTATFWSLRRKVQRLRSPGTS